MVYEGVQKHEDLKHSLEVLKSSLDNENLFKSHLVHVYQPCLSFRVYLNHVNRSIDTMLIHFLPLTCSEHQ